MEVVEKLMTDIFDNRHSYKEGDYIAICKTLKDFYNKVKGVPVIIDESKDMAEDASDHDSQSDDDSFGYSDQYIPSYAGDYIDPY